MIETPKPDPHAAHREWCRIWLQVKRESLAEAEAKVKFWSDEVARLKREIKRMTP